MFKRELAFVHGAQDAANGRPCPYKRGTVEWHAWLAGFTAYCEKEVASV